MTDVRLTATNPDDSSVVPVACNAKGELKLEEPTINSDDYVAKAGDNMTGSLTIGPDDGPAVTTLADNGYADFKRTIVDGDDTHYLSTIINSSIPGTGATRFNIGGSDVQNGNSSDTNWRIYTDGSAEFAGGGIQLFSVGAISCKASLDTAGGLSQIWYQSDGVTPAMKIAGNGALLIGGDVGSNANIVFFGADGSARFNGDVVIGSRNKKWMIVESGGIAHLVEQASTADVQPARYPELRNIPQELDLVEQALSEVMEKLRMKPPVGWPVWDGSDED